MAERDSMRCRKGDQKISIQNLEGRITSYIDRDRVKPEVQQRISEQLSYLGHLALTINKPGWPQPLAEFEEDVRRFHAERAEKASATTIPETETKP